MEILEILVSQRKLRAPKQLCGMLDALKSGQVLPPIELIRDAHGAVQIMDGHHRLSAIWLSGRRKLHPEEYVLIESDRYRPRFGTAVDLLRRCGIADHRDIR